MSKEIWGCPFFRSIEQFPIFISINLSLEQFYTSLLTSLLIVYWCVNFAYILFNEILCIITYLLLKRKQFFNQSDQLSITFLWFLFVANSISKLFRRIPILLFFTILFFALLDGILVVSGYYYFICKHSQRYQITILTRIRESEYVRSLQKDYFIL